MSKQRPVICIAASILTIIVGVILIIAASVYTKNTTFLRDVWTQIYALSIFSIIIGGFAVIFAIGLLYVVYRQFPALTILLSSLLVIVALLAATCGVILAIGRAQFLESSNKNTVKVFSNYSNSAHNVSSRELVEQIQQRYECCGVKNANDWTKAFLDNASTPDSCCRRMLPGCGAKSLADEAQIYLNGCAEPIYFNLRQKYTTLIGINFTLLIFVLVAAVFGIMYERYIRQQYELM